MFLSNTPDHNIDSAIMKQTALITGASSGIGKEFAIVFARQGYDLVIAARNEKRLQEIAEEITANYGSKVLVIPIDLSLKDAAEQVFQRIKKEQIQVECLVNNAGYGDFGYFTETDWGKESDMISLNITCLTQFCKLFAVEMKKRGHGRILNLGSTGSFLPGPRMAVYFATKAYVLSFSEAIRHELKGSGVTVTTLCPGPTASGFQDTAGMAGSKLFQENKIPTSAEVALFGFRAMMKGKRVAIHGIQNQVMILASKVTPQALLMCIFDKMAEKK